MASLPNPSASKQLFVRHMVYASAGRDYAGSPEPSPPVHDLRRPDPAYVTPRISLAAFADLGISASGRSPTPACR